VGNEGSDLARQRLNIASLPSIVRRDGATICAELFWPGAGVGPASELRLMGRRRPSPTRHGRRGATTKGAPDGGKRLGRSVTLCPCRCTEGKRPGGRGRTAAASAQQRHRYTATMVYNARFFCLFHRRRLF
jgi:hypothetical protein